MLFATKFLIMAILTSCLLLFSNERWRKYNTVLMIFYLFITGVIFLI